MVLLPRESPALQPLLCAPDTAPCPRCRALCARHERVVMSRQAGSLHGTATQQTAIVGAYLCPDCPPKQRWFRLDIPGFLPKHHYTPDTKRVLRSLARTYNLSFEATAAFGRNELGLQTLHHSTIARWFAEDDQQQAFDYQHHLQHALSCFSGQLALDELYEGGRYVLRATDPINNLEITAWLGIGHPNADEVRALLVELKEAGFEPLLVVTDGSKLYPGPISEVWPAAEHQLCVFHFLMEANKTLTRAFWAAYNAMPAPSKRKGRPKKRGRPRKDAIKKQNREKVRRARYLLFKRGGVDERDRDRLTADEQQQLQEVLRLCPALSVLRRFVVLLYELFGPNTTSAEEADKLRQVLLNDAAFQQNTAISKVLSRLSDETQWKRLIRYHDFEGARKTSNHVERRNREHRRRQRPHYRLRSIRSLWALLNVTLQTQSMPTKPVRLTRRRPSENQPKEVTNS